MYEDFLTPTDAIIKHLFDPRYPNKFIPLQGKYLYLQHYLSLHWQDICGSNLARRCGVEKLAGNELYIRTGNSLLANELYMMQDLFLQKINAYLLGALIIKKLYFHTGRLLGRLKPSRSPVRTALPSHTVQASRLRMYLVMDHSNTTHEATDTISTIAAPSPKNQRLAARAGSKAMHTPYMFFLTESPP